MRFTQLKRLFLYALGSWFFSIIIMMSTRIFLLLTNTSSQLRSDYQQDIWSLINWGLRFDIKAATIIFGSVFLMSLFCLIKTNWMQSSHQYLNRFYGILLWLIAVLSIANIFYFRTYDKQFDVFIFGLIEDDTIAILKTFWSDYPVIRIVLSYALLAYGLQKFVLWYQNKVNHLKLKEYSWFLNTITMLMIIVLITLGTRGSVGTFPLRQHDAQISPLNILNSLVSNGIMSLNWAYNDQKLSQEFTTATDEEGEKLLTQFFDEPRTANLEQFINTTPTNSVVEQHQPNVVLAVMESMGEHLNQFDHSNRDLLGELRSHFDEDWLYSRFVSEGDGTSDSLHRFFIRSPFNNISQSSKQNATFKTNMFKPYLDAGYDVIYLTAGNGAWRNFNQFLKHLGVTEVIEENTLRKIYPEAKGNTWGVPDEYMFRYATERLEQAEKTGKPVFIMMMSITHHPPFELPHTATEKQFNLTPAEINRLEKLAKPLELNKIFNTLHYSNNALGHFISSVKNNQALQPHTIIAATGDHNIRAIGYPDPKEQVLHHAVPFYLYVPKAYQANAIYDQARVGSHKDIVPTLYALSLSNQPFYQNGCNITAVNMDNTWCNVGYNPHIMLTPKGAYNFSAKTYHLWQDKTGTLLQDASEIQPEENTTINRWQAFTPLMHWQLNRQFNQ